MFEVSVCTRTGKVLRRFDLTDPLSAGRCVRIGRAEDCDICIRADGVSRYHCEIAPEDVDACVVRDLGSTYGTYVNGRRVEELEIEPGLAVQVGPAVLRFHPVTPRVSRELQEQLREELGAGDDS